MQPNYVKIDKKDENKNTGTSIEAELEILKLLSENNSTAPINAGGLYNHLTMINSHPDKPKRDNTAVNDTDSESIKNPPEDQGQKELVFGHVNVDPVLYQVNNEDDKPDITEDKRQPSSTQPDHKPSDTTSNNDKNDTDTTLHSETLKKDGDKTKLNPENDYSDIGEAIKLISRYAEVTTDDNFSKDQKNNAAKDDSILGTRTKVQHRRNKPKISETTEALPDKNLPDSRDKTEAQSMYPKNAVYFRYPWPNQHFATPPPNYPFRHIQDYWPGRTKFGGVYNTHENPRRHHHSYPHTFRPQGYRYARADLPPRVAYPEQLKGYFHRIIQHHMQQPRNNQDLYSLLGLRHWFSSEGASKR